MLKNQRKNGQFDQVNLKGNQKTNVIFIDLHQQFLYLCFLGISSC